MSNKASLDCIIVSKAEHLSILRLAIGSLQKYTNINNIYIITGLNNFPKLAGLANNVVLIDENLVLPSMTIYDLQVVKNILLTKYPGWYFQQLLKLSCAYNETISDNYLVWDADTVLLRPLEFIDNDGKMIFTIATEYHPDYFLNYRKLIGEEPMREYSFIAQHMVMNKSIVKEMLENIDKRFPGKDDWPWKIINNLCGKSNQLFSEYEFYGHYVKKHYPDKFAIREIPWTRSGSSLTRGNPTPADLEQLSKKYFYASFEIWDSKINKLKNLAKPKVIYNKLNNLIKKICSYPEV